MVGIHVPEYPTYVPAWSEVLITVGIVAAGLLAFRAVVEFLPIYGEEAEGALEEPALVGEPVTDVVGVIPASVLARR
jgi:Ni/Fe-hydrogenase subunit HybB-like protein